MSSKIVHLFDEVTGVFITDYPAQESPLEPGKYLAPVHSTELPLSKLASNQAAVFKEGAWTVESDYRGQTWFDSTTGLQSVIEEVGAPAPNLQPTQPAPAALTPAQELAQAQSAQLAILLNAYAAAAQVSVSYETVNGVSKLFQADYSSQNALAKAVGMYSLPKAVLPADYYWVAADNTKVPFTLADLQGLTAVIGTQGWTAFQRFQTQKDAINAAATVATVQAIVW